MNPEVQEKIKEILVEHHLIVTDRLAHQAIQALTALIAEERIAELENAGHAVGYAGRKTGCGYINARIQELKKLKGER